LFFSRLIVPLQDDNNNEYGNREQIRRAARVAWREGYGKPHRGGEGAG
jgi:hypothetical protein